MFIAKVPNRTSPPAYLLRESYREDGKVKSRTLANLTCLPAAAREALRRALRGETLVPVEEAFTIVRSRPHGHVAAVLGALKGLGLDRLLHSRRSRQRDLVVAMIVARLIGAEGAKSKLAACRGMQELTMTSSLADVLGLGQVEVHELYDALDWLLERQHAIERKLADRHLEEGGRALYDLSAVTVEGRTCPLAALGYARGSKKGKRQINFGMLCDRQGRPVAIRVYRGNTSDPATVADQVETLRRRFGLDDCVVVGDRGMLTAARIREDLEPADLGWITSLRAPQIRKLVEQEAFQLSLFDEQDLAEIEHDSYPGERLVVCKNPLLAEERARKRTAMLADTEARLQEVVEATQRTKRPLRGKAPIGVRVGKVLARSKMGKHFTLTIEDDRLSFQRNEERIREEAALDGIYILRTSVPEEELSTDAVVEAYKELAKVERAFRTLKSADIQVRPIHHRAPDRVRAHFLLCMLTYYVEWHVRCLLAPLLFTEHDPEAAKAARGSVVRSAQRSPSARAKDATKQTEEGLPVHSFPTLLRDLATIVRNHVVTGIEGVEFDRITEPTELQARAFELLGVQL